MTFQEAECYRGYDLTGNELNDPTIIFMKEPFIPVGSDDRIVSVAQTERFTVDSTAKMAVDDASFPDVTDICFRVQITPDNSP